MAISKIVKEQQVIDIQNLVSKANSFIVWDYLGLTALELSILRSKISKIGGVNKVYKNRVAKIALENEGKNEILEYLLGPSSFLFILDDNLQSLKEILEIIKKNSGKIKFKAGYIEGEFLDEKGIMEQALLPSKNELLSILLSVLKANTRNLANLIYQISNKASIIDKNVENKNIVQENEEIKNKDEKLKQTKEDKKENSENIKEEKESEKKE